MTNAEKYRTAEERGRAFGKFCGEHRCESCVLNCGGLYSCMFAWLEMSADEMADEEEKPLPCPLCGGRMGVHGPHLTCVRCRLSIYYGTTTKETVSAFNRIARNDGGW